MPRMPRIAIGGYVYHVLNRANDRRTIFDDPRAYQEFEYLLFEASGQFNMRILAYALMPNHWHLLLYPREDNDMANFMRWLTTSHATRYRFKTDTVGNGHLYQGRYKSFIVDTDAYMLTALKYIERNPVRAGLAGLSEDWRWGSAYRRVNGTEKEKALLAASPVPLPHRYREWVNDPESSEELKEIRNSVNREVPFGGEKFLSQFSPQKKKQK